MGILEKIAESIAYLIPQEHESAAVVRRWRIKVALTQMLTMAALTLHIFWACGWIPGVPGFARSADMQDVQTSVQAIRVEQLRAALFPARVLQCRSRGSPESTGASGLTSERVSQLLNDYYRLTGVEYRLTDCADL